MCVRERHREDFVKACFFSAIFCKKVTYFADLGMQVKSATEFNFLPSGKTSNPEANFNC